MYPICEEPMVHRVRVAQIDGKPHIVLAPLMGRDSTKERNWMDGRPVRILAFPIPKDPVKGVQSRHSWQFRSDSRLRRVSGV
jgi:hypothetical protein